MSKYRVTITTKSTYTYETETDEDFMAIAEAFDRRYSWQWKNDVAYEVNVKEADDDGDR